METPSGHPSSPTQISTISKQPKTPHSESSHLWNDPVAMAGLLALWNDAMGLPGAVRDPGWRNGDRDGRNTLDPSLNMETPSGVFPYLMMGRVMVL